MTDVTVIIAVSEEWGFLPRQLQALADQVDPPDFEVLLADSGCQRDLSGLVKGWQERLDIREVDATARPGDGYARNVATSFATGDVVMFTGTDVALSSDWIRRGIDAGRGAVVFTGADSDESVAVRASGNFGVSRLAVIAAGGFDASLSGKDADDDLLHRLVEGGHSVTRVPGMTVVPASVAGPERGALSARVRGFFTQRSPGAGPDVGAGLDAATSDLPSVSVVIPHYGEVSPTMEVVGDLMAQDGVDSVEIIVSDDCSPVPFPDGDGWEVVRSTVNGGYGAACNRGAATASGDFVLFLNSDVTVGHDFLRRFLAAAKPWGRAITAPAVRQADHPAPVARFWGKPHQYIANWATPGARFHGQEWFDRLQGQDVTSVKAATRSGRGVAVDWVAGVAHMMPLEDFRAVGGFDEDYFMYCEEMDLHRRLHEERGLKAVYLPQVEIGHAGGGSSSTDRVRSWNVDGQFRFFDKWGGTRRFLAGMVATSVLNAGWNVVKKARGADVDPAETFSDEWSTIMHGWQHRGDTGPQRAASRRAGP